MGTINERTIEYRCTSCAAWATSLEDLKNHRCENYCRNVRYIMPDRMESQSEILQFWAWWDAMGSGIVPREGEDMEVFAQRIAMEAWKYGPTRWLVKEMR